MTDEAAIAELPELLAEVAEACGLAIAAQLSAAFGGTQIYMPVAPGAEHPITKAIGADAAATLANIYGGQRITIPLGPDASHARRRRAIRDLLARGWSHRRIARRLNCHVRTVERVAADSPADARQLDLLGRLG